MTGLPRSHAKDIEDLYIHIAPCSVHRPHLSIFDRDPAEIEQKSSKPLELQPELESQWASQLQLVTFRATATKIADDI